MKINFRPTVYMRNKTHTYLWIRDGRNYGLFLTMDSGDISLEKVPREDGPDGPVYRVYESKQEVWELEATAYDFLKAVTKYHSSLLQRSRSAEREMRNLLGLPPLGDNEDLSPPDRPDRPKKDPSGASGKPAKVVRPVKEPSAGGYSLAQLCSDLKIDPSEARKTLRSKKIEKPGARWEWANAEAASGVRKALS